MVVLAALAGWAGRARRAAWSLLLVMMAIAIIVKLHVMGVNAKLLSAFAPDFLFWSALHVARDQLVRHVLATPPEQVAGASESERAGVEDMAERIPPVSARAAGLRDDTRLGKRLGPSALESIQVPTLVVSARDDGFGTYAAAQYTASRIPAAKFVGFDEGGHLLVGHEAAVRAEIVTLLSRRPRP